jgi:hypothetical protein
LKQLETERSGIELVNVRIVNNITLALVFVPNGKLKHFITRFTEYLTKTKKEGEPRHQELIDSIEKIRSAALESFWMEPGGIPFPSPTAIISWEVWLRVGRNPTEVTEAFRQEATQRGLQVGQRSILFRDRAVLLVLGTRAQLESSLDILNVIAELRLAKECPTSFVQMTPREQAEWSEEALRRVTPPPADATATCILDTGVFLGHPLLDLALHPSHALTCFPGQVPHDHDGHGTEMAGVALYGDLTEILASTARWCSPIALSRSKSCRRSAPITPTFTERLPARPWAAWRQRHRFERGSSRWRLPPSIRETRDSPPRGPES